jgi:hypothetical protein
MPDAVGRLLCCLLVVGACGTGCRPHSPSVGQHANVASTDKEGKLITAAVAWLRGHSEPALQQYVNDPTMRVTSIVPVKSLTQMENYNILMFANQKGPYGIVLVSDSARFMGASEDSNVLPSSAELKKLLSEKGLRPTGEVQWFCVFGEAVRADSPFAPLAKVNTDGGPAYVNRWRDVFVEDPSGPLLVMTKQGSFAVTPLQ